MMLVEPPPTPASRIIVVRIDGPDPDDADCNGEAFALAAFAAGVVYGAVAVGLLWRFWP